MELTIPEIQTILNEIQDLKKMQQNESYINQLKAEWYNDQQCWELKGGCSLSTYRSNRYYQIKGGRPDAYVGGRKVWNKESVMEWLSITDDQLEEYHYKYKTGAKKK